eukprot:15435947-Alexandrium_andersonii.AAC.1
MRVLLSRTRCSAPLRLGCSLATVAPGRLTWRRQTCHRCRHLPRLPHQRLQAAGPQQLLPPPLLAGSACEAAGQEEALSHSRCLRLNTEHRPRFRGRRPDE